LVSKKKKTYKVFIDDEGREYIGTTYNEKEKNHPGLKRNEQERCGRIYAQPDELMCPVKLFKLYLSKLHPDCEFLWQVPNKKFLRDGKWYHNNAHGVNTLGQMFKQITTSAKCSSGFTNHSLRATSITAMKRASYWESDIMAISGHKSKESLKHYIATPDSSELAIISKSIHTYGSDSKQNSLDVQHHRPIAPRPPIDSGLHKQTATAMFSGEHNVAFSTSSHAMHAGMFAGATITGNATFNIYLK
jgi:hypothetical protein